MTDVWTCFSWSSIISGACPERRPLVATDRFASAISATAGNADAQPYKNLGAYQDFTRDADPQPYQDLGAYQNFTRRRFIRHLGFRGGGFIRIVFALTNK
uniref:Uncharacterized protein n=1 Tax=Physcomitrium patens TaxID=3218 RepID=A0A2K1JRG5_PHYPA|nr:hypothetical protein PHYPA_016429 [Physcomitrium patens]